jgi:hypothetical protein
VPRGGRRSFGSTRQTVAPCAPEPSRCGRRAPIRLVVELGRGRGHVGIDLGLERRNQHPAGAVTHDLVEDLGKFRALGFVLDYPQHRRLLPAGGSNAGTIVWIRWEGTPRSPSGSGFHNFWSYLAGGAFRALKDKLPAIELSEVRRQSRAWEREALELLREGRAAEAVQMYGDRNRLVVGRDAVETRAALVADWWQAPRDERPSERNEWRRIVLAIEEYRDKYGIRDRNRALGGEPRNAEQRHAKEQIERDIDERKERRQAGSRDNDLGIERSLELAL